MPIKSFRGMMQENQVDVIPLSTNTGKVGYRITKMQVMPVDTGGASNTSNEATIQIYSIKNTADAQAALTNANIDFSDNTLLGVAYFTRDQGVVAVNSETIIFDNTKFNQDVFIVYKDSQTNNVGMNYYIEMEASTLSLDENTVATLKDIRNIVSNE
jgi:hypothetical protein